MCFPRRYPHLTAVYENIPGVHDNYQKSLRPKSRGYFVKQQLETTISRKIESVDRQCQILKHNKQKFHCTEIEMEESE